MQNYIRKKYTVRLYRNKKADKSILKMTKNM